MQINHHVTPPEQEYDPEINSGSYEVVDDQTGKVIGLLEYHIKNDILHVDNLKNYFPDQYGGVGTALMNSALNLALKSQLGFAFDVAKDSQDFYKSWLPRTFEQGIDKRPFETIAMKHKGCVYTFNQINRFKKDSLNQFPLSFIKKRNLEDQRPTVAQLLSDSQKKDLYSSNPRSDFSPPSNDNQFPDSKQTINKK